MPDADTTKHPFDVDGYQKGDLVSAAVIEQAYGVKRDTKEYAFAAMRASDYIRREFAKRGETVTIKHQGADIRICTDESQHDVNGKAYSAGVRKMRRAHFRRLGADRSKIKDKEILAEHDRDLVVQGAQLTALRQARRLANPPPVKRLTPGRKGEK